ncbi:DeoR family transcriptional regulator [Pasteurellaceae bacterium Pebbles2]|nr:DeoR family transcriptional regulator [Pasteurellaceae bacterium Pebbles2]
MLKEERKQKILDILQLERKVIASDLSRLFDVSEDTIRRDLKELDTLGLIKRVHSGALLLGPPITDFSYRQTVSPETKIKIAKKALPFLKEGSVIIIDGGTTNLALANIIPIDFKATIITNSPPIAIELSQHKNIEIINIGGMLYKQSMINIGVGAYKALEKMRADLYIMGIYNIDIDKGSSVPTLEEAEIKQIMSDISTEILAMVTNDKFDTISNHIVGQVDEISYLVSDQVPEKIKKEYCKKNIFFLD